MSSNAEGERVSAGDRAQEIALRLKHGLFISAMMGVINGRAAARIGANACMVQLGAILKEDLEHLTHDPRFVLPGEEREYAALLRNEIRPVREALGDVPVCWNTAAGDVESAVRFANAAAAGGADLYELNFNGGYGKLIKKAIIRAMALPRNRETLIACVRELVQRSPVPVIAKFYAGMRGVDYGELAEQLSGFGLFGLHLNVRSATEWAPNLEVVGQVRPRFEGVLLCSGRVRTRDHVDGLFEAGADCVGIAQALVQDAFLISKLALEGKRRGWVTARDIVADEGTAASGPASRAEPEQEGSASSR